MKNQLNSPKTGQHYLAESLNQQFFKDNDSYKFIQNELEHYQFIAKSAAHETKSAKCLLDVGNGGVFIYPITNISNITAIDIFIEEDFKKRYPNVTWLQMSALDMKFDHLFDTVIEINTLHHIIGNSVTETYKNLDIIMEQMRKVMENGGKLILLESTVPQWFLYLYKIIFPLLIRIWPLKHPPTFQFHYRDILAAGKKAGLILEEFCWIPKVGDILQLGYRVKGWLSPIQTGKFVFIKKALSH
jgi:hypothetical protein